MQQLASPRFSTAQFQIVLDCSRCNENYHQSEKPFSSDVFKSGSTGQKAALGSLFPGAPPTSSKIKKRKGRKKWTKTQDFALEFCMKVFGRDFELIHRLMPQFKEHFLRKKAARLDWPNHFRGTESSLKPLVLTAHSPHASSPFPYPCTPSLRPAKQLKTSRAPPEKARPGASGGFFDAGEGFFDDMRLDQGGDWGERHATPLDLGRSEKGFSRNFSSRRYGGADFSKLSFELFGEKRKRKDSEDNKLVEFKSPEKSFWKNHKEMPPLELTGVQENKSQEWGVKALPALDDFFC